MNEESERLLLRQTVRRRAGYGCLAIAGFLILLALVMPGVRCSSCRDGMRYSASSCASQLAKTYYAYCFSSEKARVITSAEAGGTLDGFALFFAAKCQMNTPDLWFIWGDPALDAINIKPLQVADLGDPANPKPDAVFVAAKPKSFAVVVDIPNPEKSEARADSYPVVWTRGLGPSGWRKDSPWQGKGGHVAYLDGHVVWYDSDDLVGGKPFKDYLTGEPTSDIRKAVEPGATVLEDK